MAVGDQQDIFSRLKSTLPTRWFGTSADSTPILDAVLGGIAGVLAWLYSLCQYAKLQTRIAWATDGWLDIIAADFFGASLPRVAGESDGSYRSRIKAALIQAKATRSAIIQAVTALTGRAPLIFEPWRPADAGAYNQPATLAWNTAGAWGSLALPAQYFITCFRPHASTGLANVMGWGVTVGAWNTGSQINYASLTNWNANVPDSAIYDCVAKTTAAGVIAWTRIES
jgi:hypothetical protein